MNYIGIFKTSYHMYNSVHLTDIGKELIAQSLSFAGSFYKSRDIHKLDHRRSHFFGVIKVSQQFQPFIRYCHHAHIGINGTEGIVCGLRSRFCQ